MVTMLAGTATGLVELAGGRVVETHLDGRPVRALAGDGAGWWALVDSHEVWHGDAAHHGWHLLATSDQQLTCLGAGPDGLMVGTAGAHLLRLAGSRLETVEGFDTVDGRDRWYTPWGGPPDTRSLSHDGMGTMYANVHVGGIAASSGDARPWRPTDLDIDADVHQVLAGAAPDLVLAACAEGLAVSDDGGHRWRIDAKGLHATYSRAVAVAGDTAVVSASTGPRGDRSGLYRRPLQHTGAFERCTQGLPPWFEGNIDTGCLVATGATVAFAPGDGSVFVSTDGGARFDRAATGLGDVVCLALVSA